ncbi:hypothetical protein [Vibrio bivalvicida]|uniref:Uncharacterized protein n=1 Tax=Vibrio bivalvicida TaxID=1276888 RepID=A0A177Y0W6_9VIBR|nr:hypothetical protein [Vibrio bivalvicida]OAJ94457.1 hypothetical protein APB76_09765 [Vibrio bivalvicida]
MKENIELLEDFIANQKVRWHSKNNQGSGIIDWNADSLSIGPMGEAWLRGHSKASVIFNRTGSINKLKSKTIESPLYRDFLRALFMADISLTSEVSASRLRANNIIARQLYYSLDEVTGQSNPIFISHDVFSHAFESIRSAKSNDINNILNSAIQLQCMSKTLDGLKFTLTKIDWQHNLGGLNTSGTKRRKIAEKAKLSSNGEFDPYEIEGASKLISLETFLFIVSLIRVAKSDGERILLNLLLLLIVTGFRYEEASALALDSLDKVPLKSKDAIELAKKFGLPQYDLKINYLAMKGSTARAHWVEPTSIPLVEGIYKALIALTHPYREQLKKSRLSSFNNFLPANVERITGESVLLDDLCDSLISTSGSSFSNVKSNMRKALANIGLHPSYEERLRPTTVDYYYDKAEINMALKSYAEKRNFLNQESSFTRVRIHAGKSFPIKFEDMLFIMPDGMGGLRQKRTFHTIITDIPINIMSRFLGSSNGTSIFAKYDMRTSNGEHASLTTHIPRHNVNTFLAIAGIDDHLQAALMGRRDITQNIHYQHLALAQKLYPTSTENLVLNGEAHINSQQLSPSIESNVHHLSNELNELFGTELTELQLNSPIAYVKSTGTMVFSPRLSLEANIKRNLHTYGQHDENVKFLSDALSEEFMPDINKVYRELLLEGKTTEAHDLLSRHSHLNALTTGTCTRNLGLWGCPFGAKCLSGQECGYHSLTGRAGELEQLVRSLVTARANQKTLSELAHEDESYKESLLKINSSVSGLEKMVEKSYLALSKGTLVSLIDRPNREQLGEYKQPDSLASFFSIEQRRIEQRDKES